MPTYAVNSRVQRMLTTSVVNAVFEWVLGADGKRHQSDVQSRDEQTGMPLWDVEVIYKQTAYGRESNTTAAVRVGSPVQPVMAEFAPVQFVGLAVDVRIGKSGGLVESWHAEALADDKAAGSSSKPSAA